MMPMANALALSFRRDELYAVLDVYLDALRRDDPSLVAWAPCVRNTENNVALMLGDGLWGTNTNIGGYDLRFADLETGQIGWFGTVEESFEESAITVRLKVDRDLRIEEIETIVVRNVDSGLKFENQRFDRKSILEDLVAPERRVPRDRMLSIADGYFDTLQLNDGTLFTKFHPECNRVENGVQTTNNPDFAKLVPVAGMGCEAQFLTGNYRYDDRLRARRYPLVDIERGLVFSAAFIDHCGRLRSYLLSDGTQAESHIRRPHTFYLLELFKIEDGMIRQIEANFITVPYHMPSPWDAWFH